MRRRKRHEKRTRRRVHRKRRDHNAVHHKRRMSAKQKAALKKGQRALKAWRKRHGYRR